MQPDNAKQDGDLQAYLTSILYGHEIWAPALTGRLRDQLTSLQRKAILALTGAYSTTNNLKLLDLIEVLEINAESACQLESRWKDFEEKKQIRTAHLARQRNRIEGEPYVNLFADKLTSIRRKESFWFMSAHGPFRARRVQFDRNQPTNCRLCGLVDESPLHLLYDCAHFANHPKRDTPLDPALIEERCREIIFKLYQT